MEITGNSGQVSPAGSSAGVAEVGAPKDDRVDLCALGQVLQRRLRCVAAELRAVSRVGGVSSPSRRARARRTRLGGCERLECATKGPKGGPAGACDVDGHACRERRERASEAAGNLELPAASLLLDKCRPRTRHTASHMHTFRTDFRVLSEGRDEDVESASGLLFIEGDEDIECRKINNRICSTGRERTGRG